jgi:hypothetical protein
MAKWYEKAYRKTKNVTGDALAYGLAVPTGGLSLLGKQGYRDRVGGLWNDATGVTAAEGAAKAQREGLDKAQTSQEKMFQQSLDTQKPWLEAGGRGLSQLEAGINSGEFESQQGTFNEPKYTEQQYTGPAAFQDMKFDFEADPGYQFRMAEGNKAIEASAAARGGLFSGKTGTDLQNFSQGLASQEYGNAYNRFADQRDFNRNTYETDRAFGRGNFENDRTFGRANFLDDRAFGYGQFGDNFNRDRALKTDKYNRLASLAGVGQMTAGNVANQQIEQGGNLGNLAMQRGNIGAQRSQAGYQGAMNLFNTGLQGVALGAKLFGG